MTNPPFESASQAASRFLEHAVALHARYRRGEIHARVPAALLDPDLGLDEAVAAGLPASQRALAAAANSLFFSLPVAFDPEHSIGPYLATMDRDEHGEPYRFLDMGALIATAGFGENDPSMVANVMRNLPYVVSRYAHSEYQTELSLRFKAALDRIAPSGTPRHFVVNTGAETVENAIKSLLLNRVKTGGDPDGGFIVSFEGAFHGRTLGSLAVTHRRKARLGFPTFDWPQAIFPVDVPGAPRETARREERCLKQIWDLLVSGRLPHADKSRDAFLRELEAIDAFLETPVGDLAAFAAAQRATLAPETLRRARRAAAVLVEPIQGEGGVRSTTARFMRRLRVLTRIYDVPLVFDEVQTGWGATGTMWAHERFELPGPPDVVTWAKKAQNGVLFVSEELATFFQEEKKFNTTWEGDSAGMVRLLAILDTMDLDRVRRTGALARDRLEALARDYPELIRDVRGAGVMLAFDVARADWRDALRERAFRLGLVTLPAGDRALRFYPRYDIEPYAIDEAIGLLRRAIDEISDDRAGAVVSTGPEVRIGPLECPIEAVEVLELAGEAFATLRAEVMAVEIDRYGAATRYPPGVLLSGRRPLIQYPAETLEATASNPRAIGIALRDRVSGRVVAYALGSPLENHDEEGVHLDPHWGEHDTFYLQALATLSSIRNQVEVENVLLDLMRARSTAAGFAQISTLIEQRIHDTAPGWMRTLAPLQVRENYLRSGIRFVYLQAALAASPAGEDSRRSA